MNHGYWSTSPDVRHSVDILSRKTVLANRRGKSWFFTSTVSCAVICQVLGPTYTGLWSLPNEGEWFINYAWTISWAVFTRFQSPVSNCRYLGNSNPFFAYTREKSRVGSNRSWKGQKRRFQRTRVLGKLGPRSGPVYSYNKWNLLRRKCPERHVLFSGPSWW